MESIQTTVEFKVRCCATALQWLMFIRIFNNIYHMNITVVNAIVVLSEKNVQFKHFIIINSNNNINTFKLGAAATGVGFKGPFTMHQHCSSLIQQITLKQINISFYTMLLQYIAAYQLHAVSRTKQGTQFPTVRQVLEALRVEWRNSSSRSASTPERRN